ncbi:CubicO group peptidase (beta-lactamase class C family) [Brevundimonas vesicularis]|uniref:serine hydrolase n=1 Tax=Brevundimonas vesicularis TaxID=41276 RepID=UPI0027811C05|nr:serine hydrolase [Brevundimonas vesicularis]MDQ1191585.1 CubicO group peptidase (beta-lactamase class C family) [Brevundimonas vesicularis]
MLFRLVFALPFVVALMATPLHALAQSTTSSSTDADLDVWVQRQMELRSIPGMQVAVVKNGQIVYSRAYGVANLQTPVPVTQDTVFSINSATKSFTGVEVMRLVESGEVDLSAPVSTYLADLPETWRRITVRQLLTHMSGLPDILTPDGGYVERDAASALAVLADQPLRSAPGERFAYNQTNYMLLGMIIEQARGRSFETVVAEDAFRALGMAHSGFGDSLDLISGKADSYRYSRGETPVLQNVYELFPAFTRTAAGINSSAQDLAHWLIALQTGKILKPATLNTLWSPASFNDGKIGEWANGWVVVDRQIHPAVGMSGGGRSAFSVYPRDGVAVIILTNLSGAYPEELTDPIAARFIPGMTLTGVPALRERLETEGFEQAEEVAANLVARDGAASLPESDLNNWGYRLLARGRLAEALAVMKLIVGLYPESGNAHDSLAEVYARSGDRTRAIENYRRSLMLDPANANAAEQLEALQGEP